MSYMELCLRLDGKEDLYLRVPTLWDEVEKQWIGFVKTPNLKKLVTGKGKDSFDLQNSFNVEMSAAFHAGDKELADDLFSMFKPKKYWEELEELE